MKILIFVRSLDVGGTERQVGILARGLAARGHEVVLTQLYGGGALEAQLADSQVRLVAIGKKSRWDVFGPLQRLRELFVTEGADVIYAFLPMQNVLAAMLRPKGIPLVFGARASDMQMAHYDRLSAWSYRAEAMLSGCADLIIANAESFRDAAAARGFRNEEITVIPNAIDTDANRVDPAARKRMREAWRIDDRTFVVGMVARLDPMKDHRNCLRAAADFVKQHGAVKIVFAGSGPSDYRAQLVAMAGELGLTQSVLFVGEQKDVVGAYNAFDIATLSSAFGEGFPNVIGEAMACGAPVAATDVGDARLIVGECGEIVPPSNPAALSEAWRYLRQRLAGDPALRQKARQRIVTRYGLAHMIDATESALVAVAQGPEVPGDRLSI
jgi:glycosyltransferase involved in cell wall biosynthesis